MAQEAQRGKRPLILKCERRQWKRQNGFQGIRRRSETNYNPSILNLLGNVFRKTWQMIFPRQLMRRFEAKFHRKVMDK